MSTRFVSITTEPRDLPAGRKFGTYKVKLTNSATGAVVIETHTDGPTLQVTVDAGASYAIEVQAFGADGGPLGEIVSGVGVVEADPAPIAEKYNAPVSVTLVLSV